MHACVVMRGGGRWWWCVVVGGGRHRLVSGAGGQHVLVEGVERQAVDLRRVRLGCMHHACTRRSRPEQVVYCSTRLVTDSPRHGQTSSAGKAAALVKFICHFQRQCCCEDADTSHITHRIELQIVAYHYFSGRRRCICNTAAPQRPREPTVGQDVESVGHFGSRETAQIPGCPQGAAD